MSSVQIPRDEVKEFLIDVIKTKLVRTMDICFTSRRLTDVAREALVNLIMKNCKEKQLKKEEEKIRTWTILVVWWCVLAAVPVSWPGTMRGEMSHHEVLHFVSSGVTVIVVDHSNTEWGYLARVLNKLSLLLPGV